MKNKNPTVYDVYTDQIANGSRNCWANKVKSLIDELGFTEIMNSYDENVNYLPIIKRRLRDQYIQTWNASIRDTPKIEYYCGFKTTFELETYLTCIKNDNLRQQLSRLRLSSHSLEIEVGRYNGTVRENRICKLCNLNVVESEYHFVSVCPTLRTLRTQYLENMTWPTLGHFYRLLSSKKPKTLLNCAKYINVANKLRKSILENI